MAFSHWHGYHTHSRPTRADSSRGSDGTLVHHPTRLRPWLNVFVSSCKRLDRTYIRRSHSDTIRILEKSARRTPRTFLTVEEYLNKGFFGRLLYRLYRHPIVMFGLGPAYLFLLRHRLPIGAMKSGHKPWISALANNLGIIVFSAIVIYLTSWSAFLIIQIPIVVLGASIGVWMFYVQHQFEETQWDRSQSWKHETSALHGSSYYDLPKPLMWITGKQITASGQRPSRAG